MSLYSTLEVRTRAAADAALQAIMQTAKQDHQDPDMDEAAIRLLEAIADYLMKSPRKKPPQATEPKFMPLGVVLCPVCGYQNLNWRFVCAECGKALDDDEDDAAAGGADAAAV